MPARARQSLLKPAHTPAPVGGINTVDPGTQLPALDSIYAYNLIASEQGLRTRLGYRVWADALTGAADNTVRTTMPFTGSKKNGSSNKLFSVTSLGIYDVSASGTTAATGGPDYVYLTSTVNTLTLANATGVRVNDVLADDVTGFLFSVTGIAGNVLTGTYNDAQFSAAGGSATDLNYVAPTTIARVVDFPSNAGDAGYGTFTTFTTPAGKFLLYCDEENGLYVYSETTGLWAKVALGTTQAWANATTYLAGDKVVYGGNEYLCAVGGVSAVSPATGPAGVGAGIVDGTVTWNYVAAAAVNAIGPSLADQHNALAGDPASFAFVVAWKHRLWFVERDTSRAWYLGLNSIFGTAISFDFGGAMRAGGPLVGLWNWSYDGGSGMDTPLVGISGAGDVVIYLGTDPSSSTTFGLKGCWSVGGVPYGRRVCTDFGGDLLIISLLGVVPLSKLVIGNPTVDRTIYSTQKISNLFSGLAALYQGLHGWALYVHPNDNALLILVPQAEGQATQQLAMAFANRSWSTYRDLPMLSAGVWNGQLYFGTHDGRVCVNMDYVDNVPRVDTTAPAQVQWSVLTAFRSGGNGRFRQVQLVRPIILSGEANPPYQLTLKYDFDLTEPAALNQALAGDANSWDVGKWDEMVWGGDYTPSAKVVGAVGAGQDAALAIRGAASSRTVLVGVDVHYEEGDIL